eukprot:TRINITY_DN31101_c0_g1_i1.p1 TRINITY_DN31101_c0_g1~~TRINITY_DN31101_c0_g1_i1.p1  ORF type:complete len:152 (-),score=4.88 TRINITY_DN31101_c0_g1_i1:354-809(-)
MISSIKKGCHTSYNYKFLTFSKPLQVIPQKRVLKLRAEEEPKLNAEQLAFLERKKLSKETGQVVLPRDRLCNFCDGSGQVVCNKCEGSGINDKDYVPTDRSVVSYQAAPWINVQAFFTRGGPCWLCRGKTFIQCKECEGTGFADVDELLSE